MDQTTQRIGSPYATLLRELALEDPPSVRNYTRVHVDMIEELLGRLEQRQKTELAGTN